MNKAPDIKEVNSPKFVYTHILAPHPPFTFDENGMLQSSDYNFITSDGSHYYDKGGTVDKYLEGYVNNIKALNNLLKTLINRIKENSEQPSIIILQGDHGPGSGLDWESLENTNIRERFSILNAYYFYDQNYSSLYPQITPVNSFRVIYNQYFGTDYDLLADRSFYSIWDKPYKFTEVTDSLRVSQKSVKDPTVEK
jgi:phosphoglycerol transferase MdoB-like AlkP superfamily enzyme